MVVERVMWSSSGDANVRTRWREGNELKNETYPIADLVQVPMPGFEKALDDDMPPPKPSRRKVRRRWSATFR